MPTVRILSSQRRLFAFALLLLALAACREAAGGVPIESPDAADSAAGITITLQPAGGAQQVMGPFAWEISLADDTGAPIEGAAVAIRGDMNHAGMVPVEAMATEAGEGLYRADFEWTMAGEWIITVFATLPDGREKIQTFEYTVAVR